MIPYVEAIDQEALRECLDAGRRLLASVTERITVKELTPELLHEWGLLNRWAGAIQLVYLSELSIGHRRSALAGGEAKIEDAEAHQRWFAHYFLRVYERGRRSDAETIFETLITAILDGRINVPAGWDVKWFESYLMPPKYTTLRPTFDEHSLSVRRMKELAAKGIEGIPPIDLEIPAP